jgi:dihydrofolate synthase/folylpolyglutamate synthase
VKNYDSTIDYLYGLQRHGIKLGLRNITEILKRLENPQDAFLSAHISGTNGKGSTAFALSALLKASGVRVGLFTSPHLVSFTERLRVNGEQIPEGEVVRLAAKVREISEDLNPTFFEVVTAMGFQYFKERGGQWAVVETGMGGRLDATNSLSPEVTVITPVALDHAEFLGETVEEVAREKAGIIKEDTPLVLAPQEPAAMAVIKEAANEKNAPLHIAGEAFTFDIKGHDAGGLRFDYNSESLSLKDIVLPLMGEYQALNASLAIRAFELITKDAEKSAIRAGLNDAKPPGRLEKISAEPPVYIDGAHNPAAARALAHAIGQSGMRPVLVIGVMSDKDIAHVLEPLLPLAEAVIFTAPAYGRAATPESLLDKARSLGFDGTLAPTVKDALKVAMSAEKPVLVTGSFFTIGEAREALTKTPLSRVAKLGEWQAAGP